MKKTYMHPATKVVELKRRQHLLAGSDPKLGGTYGGGTVLSRKSDFDDFDDEDY